VVTPKSGEATQKAFLTGYHIWDTEAFGAPDIYANMHQGSYPTWLLIIIVMTIQDIFIFNTEMLQDPMAVDLTVCWSWLFCYTIALSTWSNGDRLQNYHWWTRNCNSCGCEEIRSQPCWQSMYYKNSKGGKQSGCISTGSVANLDKNY